MGARAGTLRPGQGARTLVIAGNLLVLDEPTNDPDGATPEPVARRLHDAAGTALLPHSQETDA
jgi:ATPase subunit of ABC transporter with duplicated ATPase domains